MPRPVRVLVVDDSALFRALLSHGLTKEGDIEVVGRAGSGEEALAKLELLDVDVITLDVLMPGLDGFAVVREVMARRPTPILIVSSLERGKIVFQMLAAGALDVVEKPGAGGAGLGEIARRVKELAGTRTRRRPSGSAPDVPRPLPASPVVRPMPTPLPPPLVPRAAERPPGSLAPAAARPDRPPEPRPGNETAAGARRLVVIASSAGGPQALAALLPLLPADLPAAVIIVQHIATGFVGGLADWLAGESRLPVRLATAGELVTPGVILVAPDACHLVVGRDRRVLLDTSQRFGSLRPAADATFLSAAGVWGPDLLGVVLTGMGSDGAAGVKVVRAAGGRVVVQDQGTSVVWGMPQAARPFADLELPLREIPQEIARFARE